MKTNEKAKKRPPLSPLLMTALITALLATLVIGSVTLSKYTGTESAPVVAQPASAFYFESDALTETAKSYTVAGDSFSFSLYNYADALRVSETDISYSLSISGTGSLSVSGGTLSGGAASAQTVNITGGSGTVTVTATANALYTKTLSASIEFVNDSTGLEEYEIIDSIGSYVCELRIYAGAGGISANSLMINWGADMIADSTTPYFNGVQSGTGALISEPIGEYSSVSILFMKYDTSRNYSRTRTAISGGGINVFSPAP